MSGLPPVPYRTPMLDSGGLVTQQWSAFFEAMRARAGGSTGQSTTDLKTLTNELEAQIEAIETEIADAGKGRSL